MKTCPKCHSIKSLIDFSKGDGWCKSCKSEHDRKYREAHPEKQKSRCKAWREVNSEKVKAYDKQRLEKHRDEINAKKREYDRLHPEKRSYRYKKYVEEHRAKIAARNAMRYTAQRQRTLKSADPKEIEKFYQEAERLTRETGVRYSVDHIIPLHGRLVNGLHVPWNMQVITQSENSSKGNRIDTVG